jgi:hypothetical protein
VAASRTSTLTEAATCSGILRMVLQQVGGARRDGPAVSNRAGNARMAARRMLARLAPSHGLSASGHLADVQTSQPMSGVQARADAAPVLLEGPLMAPERKLRGQL